MHDYDEIGAFGLFRIGRVFDRFPDLYISFSKNLISTMKVNVIGVFILMSNE